MLSRSSTACLRKRNGGNVRRFLTTKVNQRSVGRMPSLSLSVRDIEKLRALSNESKIAAAVFKALAKRERPRDTIDLRRLRGELLKEGMVISTAEYINVFRKLQSAGFGKVISPRTASDTHRFKVKDYNSVAIGRAALGEWDATPEELETVAHVRDAKPMENIAMAELLRHMLEYAFKEGGSGVLPFSWAGELSKLIVSPKVKRSEVDALIALLTELRSYAK
jgi:hypothetical protein